MHDRTWPMRPALSALMLGAGLVWLVSIAGIPLSYATELNIGRIPAIMVGAAAAAAAIGFAAISVLPRGLVRQVGMAVLLGAAVLGALGILLTAALGDEEKLLGRFDQEWLWWYAYLAFMAAMTLVAGTATWGTSSWTRLGWATLMLGAASQWVVGVLWTLQPSAVSDLMMVGAVAFGAGSLMVGAMGLRATRRRHRWHDHLWGEHSPWSERWS